jgi:beta-1,4-mannosyl-glycoprotein beta-1,4-N-acetylglucosaminyltransferase
MNDIVEKFVLVEGNATHQGNTKPLYFAENKHLFEPFLPKITHIVADILPYPWDNKHWDRERTQRNNIMRGLTHCRDEDTIIISDLDEIPRAEAVKQYFPAKGLCELEQRSFYYYLNAFVGNWTSGKILSYGLLKQLTPCGARDSRGGYFPHAGWHFAYCGGAARVSTKFQSFAHAEHNVPQNRDPEAVRAYIAQTFSPELRGQHYTIIEPDNSWPQYVLDNLEKFKNLGFIWPPPSYDKVD